MPTVLLFRLSKSNSTIGDRAFPAAAAVRIWNSLSDSVVSASSVNSFRHQLKTLRYQRSFCGCHFSGPCSSKIWL